jgi:hypothetical protein
VVKVHKLGVVCVCENDIFQMEGHYFSHYITELDDLKAYYHPPR